MVCVCKSSRVIGQSRCSARCLRTHWNKRAAKCPTPKNERFKSQAGRYSAPPDAPTPPPHLTGGAVDLEIIDQNGARLDFTSPFDLLDNAQAAFDAPGISIEARANRELLRSVLEPTGLTSYADEWWHWSYGDNGWALRVGANHAIYDKIEMPKGADWVGDLSKLPQEVPANEFAAGSLKPEVRLRGHNAVASPQGDFRL